LFAKYILSTDTPGQVPSDKEQLLRHALFPQRDISAVENLRCVAAINQLQVKPRQMTADKVTARLLKLFR